jgi:hypothetical protein
MASYLDPRPSDVEIVEAIRSLSDRSPEGFAVRPLENN